METINRINSISELADLGRLSDAWAFNTSEGLIYAAGENLNIIYINDQCIRLLSLNEGGLPETAGDLLEAEELERLCSGEVLTKKFRKNTLKISAAAVKDCVLILIQDLTMVEEIKRKSNEIKQLNKELQTIYEQYADDTIFITDGKGRVEFSGKQVAANCGVSPEYMIGKNICELEKEKIFFPSVTGRVLESGQPEVTIQETKTGKKLVAMGTPIFDEKGGVRKIISVTRDYSRLIKIGTLISGVEEENKDGQDPDKLPENIVTCNARMLNILELVRLVAGVNSTVLIYGETGTGKEIVARSIHSSGARRNKPFITVNCGAISPNLVESELFGYEPGSFTGASRGGKTGLIEAANEGTLFLDEVSELPLNQQVKLLQVLQERVMTRVGGTNQISLDIRVIAATNKKLEKLVEEGKFRKDLFYRLNVVPVNIPPLRERTDDIALLLRHFLKVFNERYGIEKAFSKEAFQCLCDYSWPGNVRELENTVERLVITTSGSFVEPEDLPESIISETKLNEDAIAVKRIVSLNEAVEEVEKKLITMAVEKYGSGARAASALGVNQSTVSRKMKYYDICGIYSASGEKDKG